MSLRDILYKTDLQLSEFYRVLQAGLCAFLINTFEKLPIINSNLRPSQHLKRSFLGHQLIPLRRYIIDVTEVPGTPLKLVTIKSLKKGGGGQRWAKYLEDNFPSMRRCFPRGHFSGSPQNICSLFTSQICQPKFRSRGGSSYFYKYKKYRPLEISKNSVNSFQKILIFYKWGFSENGQCFMGAFL